MPSRLLSLAPVPWRTSTRRLAWRSIRSADSKPCQRCKLHWGCGWQRFTLLGTFQGFIQQISYLSLYLSSRSSNLIHFRGQTASESSSAIRFSHLSTNEAMLSFGKNKAKLLRADDVQLLLELFHRKPRCYQIQTFELPGGCFENQAAPASNPN